MKPVSFRITGEPNIELGKLQAFSSITFRLRHFEGQLTSYNVLLHEVNETAFNISHLHMVICNGAFHKQRTDKVAQSSSCRLQGKEPPMLRPRSLRFEESQVQRDTRMSNNQK
jgi:hypothetical protein